MRESSKTKALLSKEHVSILNGKGIDIGCGNDPVTDTVMRFDMEDGDANEITKYVDQKFDFVWSSHCLEHMKDPYAALLEWWKLVNDGGYLFLTVPDEDLYEQGVFPSQFNADHKHTFTISKHKSWSPVSVNVLDLIASLPDAKIVKLELQDNNYDRRLLLNAIRDNHIGRLPRGGGVALKMKLYQRYVFSVRRCLLWYKTIDQTMHFDAMAQIFVLLQKAPQK